MERDSHEPIRLLKQAGWYEAGRRGSRRHFRHLGRKGRVTAPHPRKDIEIGTLVGIYRQAGWR